MRVLARRRGRSGGRTAALALVTALASVPGLTIADARPAHLSGPVDDRAPVCDLADGGHAKDEFARCTSVVVGLSGETHPGGTVVAEVAITAVADVEGTLSVLLNDRFRLVDGRGFVSSGDHRPSGVGPMTSRARTVGLAAGETDTYRLEIEATEPGVGVVQARFAAPGHVFDGGGEATVELGEALRRLDHGLATTSAPALPEKPTAGTSPYLPAPVGGPRPLSPQAAGASCATGSWTFDDETGHQNPSANVQVQAWDDDTGSGDDLLATGVTDSAGDYRLCFESSDGEGGGQEVYVRFVAENTAWRVRNTPTSNASWAWATTVQPVPDPGTARFGTLQPTDPALHRALHAYDAINRLWLWHAGVHDRLDDPGDHRQLVVNWTPTSTDGTYYSAASNDIHLAAADPDADHVTIHEGAHALMDAIYDDDMPPSPNCNPHNIFTPSSPGCAWVEGWAEWVPARVLGDPVFRWPDGVSVDLESSTWGRPDAGPGDVTEGRVAGALIDLSDRTDDPPWDRYGEGGLGAASEEIYATNLGAVSDTLAEFFEVDRPGEGETGYLARAALFQNTIDYGHRDPLVRGEELTRPSLASAPLQHNYSFASSTNAWSVVAHRPLPGVAYDLRLFADAAQTALLATSRKGPGDVEYVVVDGNHRGGATVYPQVVRRSGGGPYVVEGDGGGAQLPRGTSTYSFAAGEVVRVFEIDVAPGVTEHLRVVPSAGLDVDLHLHDSDGTSAGSVQDRTRARVASTFEPAGVPEAVAYLSDESDRDAVVITNESGAGSFTVYYDTAGPSRPGVVVAGGDTTFDREVTLDLFAAAANGDGSTPVTDVQVSTDGTFDTEPWQAYTTSAVATLSPGLGVKTVAVRFRNAAGASSAVASDDVRLVAAPTCAGRRATIVGSGLVRGTREDDVIVGGPARDRIRGRGGDDIVCGRGGADVISAGAGADVLAGGRGRDRLDAQDGVRRNDAVAGGRGADTAVADPGDRVTGVP